MSFRSIEIVAGLESAMSALANRQKVTAANIANADTPGYKARDVALPDFGRLVARSAAGGEQGRISRPSVARTEGMQRLTSGRAATIADQQITEMKLDGNNVTLETQMLRMADIQGRYAAAASLYRKSLAMMRSALGAGA